MVEGGFESMGLVVILLVTGRFVLIIHEPIGVTQTDRCLLEGPFDCEAGAHLETKGVPMSAGGCWTIREGLKVVIVKPSQLGGETPRFGCFGVERRGRGGLHTRRAEGNQTNGGNNS